MSLFKSILLLPLLVLPFSANAQMLPFPAPFPLDLPPPPALNSVEYQRDLAKVHQYQNTRTEAQCLAAEQEIKLNLDNSFGPTTGVLTEAEVNDSRLLAGFILAEITPVIFYYKFKFRRARPYVVDKTVNPCIHSPQKNSWSYPSGHAAAGYALALALANKYPAKKELIMKRGMQIGENRVLGGVHFPSDVTAGRALALEVMIDAPIK